MSELPVQREERATTLDFTGVNVVGLAGVPGIISINGDVTPAQSLSALSPGFVTNPGAGAHVVVFPVFAPAVPGPSTPGLVPNPGAAAATDYLAADATFKPIPVPSVPSLLVDSPLVPVSVPSGVLTTVASVTGLIPGDIYMFVGQIEWQAFAANAVAIIVLFVNATAIAAQKLPFVPLAGGTVSQNLSVAGTVGAGADVVSLKAFQDSGLAINADAAGATFLQAIHI